MQLNNILPYVRKPARYIGSEVNSNTKDFDKQNLNFALAFPDIYEIGMSHLGFKIIYHMLNELKNVSCERVFSPWIDMAEKLVEHKIPLFSLETKTPISNFDILGFSLSYELSYTNILQILDLSDIAFKSKERENSPIIMAGGICAYTPEPIADFIDIFIIGDAEITLCHVIEIIKETKNNKDIKLKKNRQELLEYISQNISGCYVPAFHDKTKKIKRIIEPDLNKLYFPKNQIVPPIQIVHDRAVLEIMRGCNNCCRFCQAGVLYRPARPKKLDVLLKQADELIKKTGYEEIGLLSLSSADHPEINEIIEQLINRYRSQAVSFSIPSIRVNAFNDEIARLISSSKKTGLTFAPEAGTERLRNVLNKKVDINQLYNNVESAKKYGWRVFKLYFMIGLPTETQEDIDGIIEIVKNVSRFGNVNLSISNFVPKAHTPFQWMPMADKDYLLNTQEYLFQNLKKFKKVKIKKHDLKTNILENIFSRGDRNLSDIIIEAYKQGCVFDAWSDQFSFDKWEHVFKEFGHNIYVYNKGFDINDKLTWDHIDTGVTKDFFIKEYNKALNEDYTGDCFNQCKGCGIC